MPPGAVPDSTRRARRAGTTSLNRLKAHGIETPVSTSRPSDRAWEHVAVSMIAWTSGLVHGEPGAAHDGDPTGGDESVEETGAKNTCSLSRER